MDTKPISNEDLLEKIKRRSLETVLQQIESTSRSIETLQKILTDDMADPNLRLNAAKELLSKMFPERKERSGVDIPDLSELDTIVESMKRKQ